MKYSAALASALALQLLFSPLAQAEPGPTPAEAQPTINIESLATSLIGQAQKKQKDVTKKASDLMKRSEELLDLQEAQMKRFGKILDTWERQQKEYQAYLDTLPKPPKKSGE